MQTNLHKWFGKKLPVEQNVPDEVAPKPKKAEKKKAAAQPVKPAQPALPSAAPSRKRRAEEPLDLPARKSRLQERLCGGETKEQEAMKWVPMPPLLSTPRLPTRTHQRTRLTPLFPCASRRVVFPQQRGAAALPLAGAGQRQVRHTRPLQLQLLLPCVCIIRGPPRECVCVCLLCSRDANGKRPEDTEYDPRTLRVPSNVYAKLSGTEAHPPPPPPPPPPPHHHHHHHHLPPSSSSSCSLAALSPPSPPSLGCGSPLLTPPSAPPALQIPKSSTGRSRRSTATS